MSSDKKGIRQAEDLDPNYEVIESDTGDLVGIVDTEVVEYDAFQRGSNDFPIDPNSVPLVIHTSGEIMEGYFPNSIDGEEAYEAGSVYFSEDSIFHLKSDEERWEKSVNILLSEKREEVTDKNKRSSSIRDAYTRPRGSTEGHDNI